MDILVVYDIDTTERVGARLLTQVAKICEGYGVRVQFSVFECRLTATDLARLTYELQEILRPELDQVRIYRFAGDVSDARTILGQTSARELDGPWIF